MNRPCRSSLPSPLFTACQQQQQQQQTPSRCVPKHSGSPLQGASGDRGSVSNGTSDGAISKPVGSNISVSSSSSSSDTDSGDAAVKKTKTVNRTRRERPVGVRARVLFSFEASGPGELSVTAGQPVRALYHVGKRWLFVLTGAGQVGYIPFLYAAKEAWAPCRPVPSMRRYCREFSPQPAQQPAAADCPGEQRLCLPADLSRPPAMAPEERLPASEESSDSRRGWTRPSSLRLEPSGASLPGFEQARSSRAPQLQSVALDRPRRSSFDSAVSCVAPPAAAAVAAAKRRVTFRTDAEIIGTADNIDRQPVYQQFQPAPNEFQSGRNAAEQRHSYFGHRQGDAKSAAEAAEIDCVYQTLV